MKTPVWLSFCATVGAGLGFLTGRTRFMAVQWTAISAWAPIAGCIVFLEIGQPSHPIKGTALLVDFLIVVLASQAVFFLIALAASTLSQVRP